MHDLRTWISKRISWKHWKRVTVDGASFVSEEVAAALFAERQNLVRKLLKERARRKAIESAVRCQYEADLRQAREALSDLLDTSYTGGPQGKRARSALAAPDARLGEQRGTGGDGGVNSLVEIPDNELPGMWERADFMGGNDGR